MMTRNNILINPDGSLFLAHRISLDRKPKKEYTIVSLLAHPSIHIRHINIIIKSGTCNTSAILKKYVPSDILRRIPENINMCLWHTEHNKIERNLGATEAHHLHVFDDILIIYAYA